MSPSDWEDLVVEWAHVLKAEYARVERAAGSGDQGIDVMGFVSDTNDDPWDNYQCKHYEAGLTPSDIWVELGKLVLYTSEGAYSVPRKYVFVAPRGAGNKLSKLLRSPAQLKAGLLGNWDSHCKTEIRSAAVELTPALREYIDAFDFSIFSALAPWVLIEQHSKSPWHVARFGGGLPPRPAAPSPPPEPSEHEGRYVRALLDAYEDRVHASIAGSRSIPEPSLVGHLEKSRREFYSAEALREFSRDNVPPGSFESLIDEVHDGVSDVLEMAYPDTYERVLNVVAHARLLALTAHALTTVTHAVDRGGMCHQLANDGRIVWRR